MYNRAISAPLAAPQPLDAPEGSLVWAQATRANLDTAHAVVDGLLALVGGIGHAICGQNVPPSLNQPTSLNFTLGEATDESGRLVEKLHALGKALGA